MRVLGHKLKVRMSHVATDTGQVRIRLTIGVSGIWVNGNLNLDVPAEDIDLI